MIITKDFIMKYRTTRGSWTRSQIEDLGITWPAKRGWKDRVVGTEITEEKAESFKNYVYNKKGKGKKGRRVFTYPEQIAMYAWIDKQADDGCHEAREIICMVDS